MECTLATLVACFSWSGFFVDAGLSYQDGGLYKEYRTDTSALVVVDGEATANSDSAVLISHEATNPYVRIALGFEISLSLGDLGLIELSVEAFHQSSLATDIDRGFNGGMISAKWYPFR